MGVDGQHHAPAALPPGMIRCPLYRRLGRPQGRSGRVLKISPPPGFDPRTVQLVAIRYTDYAITVHKQVKTRTILFMCLFVVNMKTLPVSQTLYRRTVNNDWETKCEETIMAKYKIISKHLSGRTEGNYENTVTIVYKPT